MINPSAALISFLATGNKDFLDKIEGFRPEQEWYLLVTKNDAIPLRLFWSKLASNFVIDRRST